MYMVYFRNFDPLTETYGLSFYTQYLAKWPEYFQLAESPSGHIMGYSKYTLILTTNLLHSNGLQLWARLRDTWTIGMDM